MRISEKTNTILIKLLAFPFALYTLHYALYILLTSSLHPQSSNTPNGQ